MSNDHSNHDLLNAWRNGDQDAAAVLYHRYQMRLMALVRSRLSRKIARRLDPEDIVLSAYRSFFVAARVGRGVAPPDDDLWPLLATIVLRKLARQTRRHSADRRSVDQEQELDSVWMSEVRGLEPTAEHAALLSDEVERLLGSLDATAREVLVHTLQGDDAITIATDLGIHERTVRRALERIRQDLSVEGVDSSKLPRTTTRLFSARSSRSESLPQGTVVYNDYVLTQFIGAGAFSKVYRAVERSTGEVVAVKFLRKECWTDSRAVNSMIGEFNLLKDLKHPHILSMRGWGTIPRGALFLVTDYIPGRNLSEWCRMQQPSAGLIAEVVSRVAGAVAVAHGAGVFHCDLKPANVLMRPDGQVVLCDFGLARHATDPEDIPRGGTAGFLCPEQISDVFGPITARSDVYGLGGLLYALLTGRPPMTGRDLPETLANVLSAAAPEAPSRLGAISTAKLDAIALRCLEKDPSRRYATAHDVEAELIAQTVTA